MPRLGRLPGGGHINPFRYSCLENPRDRGACQAAVHRVTQSQTWLKQLSMHTCLSSALKLPPARHLHVAVKTNIAVAGWIPCNDMRFIFLPLNFSVFYFFKKIILPEGSSRTGEKGLMCSGRSLRPFTSLPCLVILSPAWPVLSNELGFCHPVLCSAKPFYPGNRGVPVETRTTWGILLSDYSKAEGIPTFLSLWQKSRPALLLCSLLPVCSDWWRATFS